MSSTIISAALPLDYGFDDDEEQPTENVSSSSTSSSSTSDGSTKASEQPQFDLASIRQKFSVNLAPEIKKADLVADAEAPFTMELKYNPKFSAMWGPVAGPELPHRQNRLNAPPKNNLVGYIEEHSMEEFAFHEQFHKGGVAGAVVVNNKKPRKRLATRENMDPGSEVYLGPWAPREGDYKPAPKTAEAEGEKEEETEEDRAAKKEVEEQQQKKKARTEFECTTEFHGAELRDYQGRSYVDPPTELKPTVNDAFLPKKRIHTWTGHTKGVSAIRLFPNYGHILVSAGLDTMIKIWDVYNDRRCLRTIYGHSKAVKDVCWAADGRKFLSSSYDRTAKLWDTETGQCLGSFSNGKFPICVKFYPKDENEFLVGGSDKKILQWDIRANQIVQEYDQHLAAVNTVTFVDEDRRFVSSSDDKTIRVWEYGIPVVIKYISEPHMHSIPAITVTPNQKFFLGQSLDNQILCYSTRDRFKLNRRKRFTGHLVAGFACQIGVSPDGKYVMSGDSTGNLRFWDWKTTRLYRTIKAHDGVSIGCEWHPIDPSRVVSCGWDGAIHLWD